MLLRIPSVVSSIAAMFLAWWIGKSQFGATTGRLALMLMASLPANIAYARFGWDPSHSGMLVLAGVLLSLNRQLVAVAAVYALAVWTHPTNVFAAPLILTVFAASERARATEPRSYRRIAALAICILLATAAVMSTASQAGQFANIESILARLITPSDWLTFVLLMGRLMAGEPWFVGIAGTGYGALLPVVDAATLTIAIAIAWHTIKVIRRQGFSVRAGLLIGWLFMVASYALIAGAPSLNAPTERYGFVLIAPTALVSALVLGAALARTTSATVASIAAILGGAGLLASTTLLYILPLATRTTTTSDAFASGPIEPKAGAARWIAAEVQRRGPVRVVAEDWWIYWPLAYLLAGRSVQLIDASAAPNEAARNVPLPTFDVSFADRSATLRTTSDPRGRVAWVVRGPDGHAIVEIRARPSRR
jgi:hypothetical protein